MRFFVLLIAAFVSVAYAEEFPGDELSRGFSEQTGITESDKSSVERDLLKIGGTLLIEPHVWFLADRAEENFFIMPHSLWLYGDAELNKDIRAFGKTRFVFDPTANESIISPLTGLPLQTYRTVLEDLRLSFAVEKTVFFTLGRQKIKWGSSRFWNPTDFINTSRRNFLRPDDERPGVTMFKTHVPVNRSNFYLMEIFDDANRVENIGLAGRVETAFETSEFALSALTQKGRGSAVGGDASVGVWDLDIYSEVSYVNNSEDFWSWTAGTSYDRPIFDNDLITFTLEYFNYGAGKTRTDDYQSVFLAGTYSPFYLSQHYGLFGVYLPAPGRWDDVTFYFYAIENLTDGSVLGRLDTIFTVMSDIQLTVTMAAHFGNPSGEFRVGGQRFDSSLLFRTNF